MEMIAQLVALILGLTLHEFAHAWMGHYLGDTTARREGRLTLNPLAHIDPVATLALPLLLILVHSPVVFAAAKPVPFNPWAVRGGRWGAALVGAAGPLTNLLIALFFSLWFRLLPFNPTSALFFEAIIIVNVGLFVFNLIPFPPLDGSRLLYAVAPEGLREVMDQIEQNGLTVVFILLFLAYPVIGPLVGAVTKTLVNLIVPSGPLP